MSLALLKIATFAPDKQTVNNHNFDILLMTCMISLRIPKYLICLTCVYCDYLLHVSHVVLFPSPYNKIIIDPLLILIQLHSPESNPIRCEFMLCICFLPAVYYVLLCICTSICRVLCIHLHIYISSGWLHASDIILS